MVPVQLQELRTSVTLDAKSNDVLATTSEPTTVPSIPEIVTDDGTSEYELHDLSFAHEDTGDSDHPGAR